MGKQRQSVREKRSPRKPASRFQFFPTRHPPTDPSTTFALEVVADSSGEWVGNVFRLRTLEEALQYGRDVASMWTAVRKWRVVRWGWDYKRTRELFDIMYLHDDCNKRNA
jgi:hypothetical protein